MSSALQIVLANLQQNNYASLVIVTAVGYDYVLTFSDEVEYIWTKPWTSVSMLFMLVRYAGLQNVVINMLGGYLPTWSGKGLVTSIVRLWAFFLFLGAADFVMILRVWAMYNCSRLILHILLALYSLEMIATIVVAVTDSDAGSRSVAITQMFNSRFCYLNPTFPGLATLASALQIVNGTALCILAVAQFVKQSLQMYRTMKGWQTNQYMKLLVKQGIFYFIAVFLNCLINALVAAGMSWTGWHLILLSIVWNVPMFAFTPRFILSIRELHARDVQSRRGSGIDTSFGLSSGRGTAGADMVFADVEQNEETEGIEEVPRGGATTQSGP